jgi:hypothetical protein
MLWVYVYLVGVDECTFRAFCRMLFKAEEDAILMVFLPNDLSAVCRGRFRRDEDTGANPLFRTQAVCRVFVRPAMAEKVEVLEPGGQRLIFGTQSAERDLRDARAGDDISKRKGRDGKIRHYEIR